MKTLFLRVLEAEDKATALKAVLHQRATRARRHFNVAAASFAEVPGSPFAYWVSDRVRSLFTRHAAFEAEGRMVKQGLATADDFRFVRAAWEVEPSRVGERWFGFAKGGLFSPFYADITLLVGYSAGDQVGLQAIGRYGRGATHYFLPGLTWPLRTNGLSVRILPGGCIFGHKGPAAFVGDDGTTLLAFAAITNSRPFGALVSLQLARTQLAQSYEVGLIQSTPVPSLDPAALRALGGLALRAWSLRRGLDRRTETSHAYTLPALLQVRGDCAEARARRWSDHVTATERELEAIQAEIDERCFELYGIDEDDRRAITDGLSGGQADGSDVDASDVGNDDEDTDAGADTVTLAAELVSWAVGVAFGRFDVRLGTGARVMPGEPEPFDPLPACSPGMLPGEDRLPLTAPPAGYPLQFPPDGVVVDDRGHPRDLATAVRAVFDAVFGARADAWWNEVAALLDPKGHDLRGWLGSRFFEQHVKRYSKSRRKAPIFWQLGTRLGRYSVWLYAHRLTRDTFFHLQNEVVAPKLAHEERRLAGLVEAAAGGAAARQRKELEAQEALVEELRAMLEEVKRVAPLWQPDLDDGVVLTMAPLWRLVPQHKAWQKELRSKWDELRGGAYDWAHVAMHLWPERVVPKCATDRSLAIAHGLEDVFWAEDGDGKWHGRDVDPSTVAGIIEQRTSAAVKDALRSLLEAPVPASAKSRGRRGARS